MNIARRPDGRWRARYRDAAGKEHARHFPRKIDAQRWLDGVTAAVQTGAYTDPRTAKVTFGEYAAGWQSSHVGRERTGSNIDVALRVHVLPTLGARTLTSIRRSDVQALVAALNATLAPGSVRNVVAVLGQVFAAAVDDRLIPASPATRLRLPTVDSAEVRPAPLADVAAMVDAMPARYRALGVLLAGSGLRIGEALGLQVADVDFLRRRVHVRRQRLRGGQLGPVKTPRSARTVPVGEVVVEALAAHLAAYPSGGDLFTTGQGGPLIYSGWQTVWAGVRRSTGLGLGAHDLRHFYASALIAGGATVVAVSSALGHSNASITLRVYAHLWPTDEDRGRVIMDAAIGALRADPESRSRFLRTPCGLNDDAERITAGQRE